MRASNMGITMKKSTILFSAIAALLIALGGCKKDDSSNTVDSVVGNYLVNDTTSSLTGCDGGPAGDVDYDSYGIVITKKNDNTVTISSFNGCNNSFDASVSETGIVALQSSSCGSVSNIIGSIAGNKIYFTYKFYTICEFNVRGTAVKQ